MRVAWLWLARAGGKLERREQKHQRKKLQSGRGVLGSDEGLQRVREQRGSVPLHAAKKLFHPGKQSPRF